VRIVSGFAAHNPPTTRTPTLYCGATWKISHEVIDENNIMGRTFVLKTCVV